MPKPHSRILLGLAMGGKISRPSKSMRNTLCINPNRSASSSNRGHACQHRHGRLGGSRRAANSPGRWGQSRRRSGSHSAEILCHGTRRSPAWHRSEERSARRWTAPRLPILPELREGKRAALTSPWSLRRGGIATRSRGYDAVTQSIKRSKNRGRVRLEL